MGLWDNFPIAQDQQRAADPWAAYPAAQPDPQPQQLTTDTVVSTHQPSYYLPIFNRLESSGTDAVSPKGAVGTFQVMPNTARQYMGKDFDVDTLKDPAVNQTVAAKVLSDLSGRFNHDISAMAVAYNAGPGRAMRWIKNGRDNTTLPKETQKYLGHLSRIMAEGATDPWAGFPPVYASGGSIPKFADGGGDEWAAFPVAKDQEPPSAPKDEWAAFPVAKDQETAPADAEAAPAGEEKRPGKKSWGGSFIRRAVGEAVPILGGLEITGAGQEIGGLVGGGLGALVTPFVGPEAIPAGAWAGSVIGGLGAFTAGHTATQKAQDVALGAMPTVQRALGQDEATRQADQAQHPWAGVAGNFLDQLATATPSLALNLGQRLLYGGIGASMEGYNEFRDKGSLDPLQTAVAFGEGFALDKPTRVGEALMRPGANLVRRVAGKPLLTSEPGGGTAPPPPADANTKTAAKPDEMPEPGSTVGITDADGNVTNVKITDYRTDKAGAHHTVFEMPDGSHQIAPTEGFESVMTAAGGNDAYVGQDLPGEGISADDNDRMMAGRNYGKPVPAAQIDDSQFPYYAKNEVIKQAVDEARAAAPTTDEHLENHIRSLGGIRLLNEDGTIASPEAATIVDKFKDTLPPQQREKVLRDFTDPAQRTVEFAQRLISSAAWRAADKAGEQPFFAPAGRGHDPEILRSDMSQGEHGDPGNWLSDTANSGDAPEDLVDKLSVIAGDRDGKVYHPASSVPREQFHHGELNNELTAAGVTSDDSKAVARNKLQAWRLKRHEEVGEGQYQPPAQMSDQDRDNAEGLLAAPSDITQTPKLATTGEGVHADLRDELDEWLEHFRPQDEASGLHGVANYLVQRGKQTGHEAAALYDTESGNIVHAWTSGEKELVNIPDDVGALLRSGNPGQYVLLHNHPEQMSPLSGMDVAMALRRVGTRGISAHDEGLNHHFVTPGPQYAEMLHGFEAMGYDPIDARVEASDEAKNIYNHWFNTYLSALRSKTDVSVYDDVGLAAHMAVSKLDAEGVVNYHSSLKLNPEQERFVNEAAATTGTRISDTSPISGFKEGLGEVLGKNADTTSDGGRNQNGEAGQGNDTAARGEGQLGSQRPPLSPEHQAEVDASEAGTDAGKEAKIIEALSPAHGAGTAEINHYTGEMANIAEKSNNTARNTLFFFPRTLASVHREFGRYYEALQNKIDEYAVRMKDARATIEPLVNLKPASLSKVFAVAEYHRLNDTVAPDNGKPISVYNNKYDHMASMKRGDAVMLTPEETTAYHAAQKMFKNYWTGIEEGWVRRIVGGDTFNRLGWDTNNPAANGMALKYLRDNTAISSERKLLDRAIVGHEAYEDQRNKTYISLSRWGDYHITVREKPNPKSGQDEPHVPGEAFPVRWSQFVQSPTTEHFARLINRGTKKGAVPDWASADIQSAMKRFGGTWKPNGKGGFESATHELTHGYRKPPISRDQIDIQDLSNLFGQMEHGVIRDFVTRGKTQAEARQLWDDIYDKATDTIVDNYVKQLKSGIKKKASLTPGYSGDFSRATGQYMHQASRNIADTIHRENIKEKYDAVQSLTDDQKGVRNFTKWHYNYMENPDQTLLDKIVGTMQKVGFNWTMAARPSTMMMFEAHTPQMSFPRASLGLGRWGISRVASTFAPAAVKVHNAIRFTAKDGLTLDVNRVAQKLKPETAAALKQAEREGVFGHNLGNDLSGHPETDKHPLSNLPGSTAGQKAAAVLRRVDTITASTIGAIDRANRMAMFIATFENAKNPELAKRMALFWTDMGKGSALFRAGREGTKDLATADAYHVAQNRLQNLVVAKGASTDIAAARAAVGAARERVTLNPYEIAKFMVNEAGGQYGRINTPRLAANPLGKAVLFLHGFTTRYISSAARMLWQHGPEGRAALLKMLPWILGTVGVEGIPFVQDAENLYDWLGKKFNHGHDPMISYKLRGFLANDLHLGRTGAEAVMRGPLGEVLGIDLTNRIGMGDLISREAGSSQGTGVAAYDVIASHGMNALKRQQSGQGAGAALSELAPNDIRDVYKAIHQRSAGARSPSGRRPLVPGNQITAGNTLATSLGFRPLSEERAYQRQDWYIRMLENRKHHAPSTPLFTPLPYEKFGQ